MAGPIVFAAIQVFLFGITNAQCPIQCNDAKIIGSGQMCGIPRINCDGIWHLKDPESPRCPQFRNGTWIDACLYRRNDDGTYMCFCDPGNITYQEGPDWQLGLCFDDTSIPKLFPLMINLPNNNYANCMAACIAASANSTSKYTYFGLEDGQECYCGNTEPPTSTHPQVWQLECNTTCPGSVNTTCGGTNRIQVYAIPKRLPAWLGGGCYDLPTHAFSAPSPGPPGNSYFNCMAACVAAGSTHQYFGLRRGNECWCSLTRPSTSEQVPQALCGIPCTGDPLTTCGGSGSYYQVYAIQLGR